MGVVVTDVPTIGIFVSTVDTVVGTSLSGVGVGSLLVESVVMDVGVCDVLSVDTSELVVSVVDRLGSGRQISDVKLFISNVTHLSNSRGTSTEYLLANRISVLIVIKELLTLLGINIPVVMNCPFNSLNPILDSPLLEAKAI